MGSAGAAAIRALLRGTDAAVAQGQQIVIFPEGTRTRTGRLAEKVHLRLVQACWENGIDVVPACVWDTEWAVRAEGVHALPFQKFGLEIAAPLDRSAFANADAYAAACWGRVAEMAQVRGSDRPFER